MNYHMKYREQTNQKLKRMEGDATQIQQKIAELPKTHNTLRMVIKKKGESETNENTKRQKNNYIGIV